MQDSAPYETHGIQLMITEFIFDYGSHLAGLVKQEIDRLDPKLGNSCLVLKMKHGIPYLTGHFSAKRVKGVVLNLDEKMGGKAKTTVEHWSTGIDATTLRFLTNRKIDKIIIKRNKLDRGEIWSVHFYHGNEERVPVVDVFCRAQR